MSLIIGEIWSRVKYLENIPKTPCSLRWNTIKLCHYLAMTQLMQDICRARAFQRSCIWRSSRTVDGGGGGGWPIFTSNEQPVAGVLCLFGFWVLGLLSVSCLLVLVFVYVLSVGEIDWREECKYCVI